MVQRIFLLSLFPPLPSFPITHAEILAHIPASLGPRPWLPFREPSSPRPVPLFAFQPPRHLKNDSTAADAKPTLCLLSLAFLPPSFPYVLTVSLHIESDIPPYACMVRLCVCVRARRHPWACVCVCVCLCGVRGGRERDMHLCTVNEQTLIAVLLVSSVQEGSWSRNTARRANPAIQKTSAWHFQYSPNPINS